MGAKEKLCLVCRFCGKRFWSDKKGNPIVRGNADSLILPKNHTKPSGALCPVGMESSDGRMGVVIKEDDFSYLGVFGRGPAPT